MTVIEAREALVNAMAMGISPTIPALEDFLEAVNDFCTSVNDYDEWNADKRVVTYGGDGEADVYHEPAITVAKIRTLLGYST